MVAQRAQLASAFGPVLQPYRREKGKGSQGGTFIRGNAQIHLHIEIGSKSHLKIEGQSINIAKGTKLDPAKIQGALERLLEFRTSIARDTKRAENYAEPIQDCIDWLVENGAALPVEKTPEPEPKDEGKKDAPQNTGYDDFFANMGKNTGSGGEDDFM